MNSRERIKKVLAHNEPDKLPVDFGATHITGIQASIVYKLRQWYGLDDTPAPVKIIEPYEMLGEIKDDLKEIIGVDCVGLWGRKNIFGYVNDDWKEWKLFDGTPVLVPEKFNTEIDDDGNVYQYAEGDKKYKPCAKMPKKGYYFDSIIRQKKIEEDKLDPVDNLEEFGLISDKDLNYLKIEAEKLFGNTEYALVGSFVSSAFGDIALVPGPMLKDPKGIRDVEEWYISTCTRKDYVKRIFDKQCEIAIENYRKIFNEVGNKVDVVVTTGTDFGTQNGLFISKELYREVFKPFHIRLNKWIHENTDWKIFNHTCGSIFDLIPDFIEAGFDILNPVQISAAKMDPKTLKKEFGKYLTFWGGGIDTQKTLPFKTPKEVKAEVRQLIDIFNRDGGFVFNAIHNIQSNIPIENIVAMIEVLNEFKKNI